MRQRLKLFVSFMETPVAIKFEKQIVTLYSMHQATGNMGIVWNNCAKTHKKRLQIVQNKNLKIIHNLPFHYSTSELNNQFNHKTIETVLDDFNFTFNEKCRRAMYAHLRNLIS